MLQLREKEIVITITADYPAEKLADIQSGLLFMLTSFFRQLGSDVDQESSAAYEDVLFLLRSTMPTAEQLLLIKDIQRSE